MNTFLNRQRNNTTLDQKVQAIEEAEREGKKINIGRSMACQKNTLSTWIKTADKIKAACRDSGVASNIGFKSRKWIVVFVSTYNRWSVEAGTECHCGNNYDYDKHGLTPDECNRECRNYANEINSLLDPSEKSPTNPLIGIIIGTVVSLLFILAAAVMVGVCFIKRRKEVEKNAYTSAKVPDTETMETVEYEELRDVPHCTNDSSKQKSPGVTSNDKAPAVVILEENDYDEIGDTTTEQTTNATYYNTPGKHLTLLDNPIRGENSTASHSEETQTKGSVNKAAKLIQEKSNGKFVQVDGFCGQWTFFAYKCPTGSDAVGEFWRFVGDRNIQNVVLLEDVACKVLPAASGSTFEGIKVFCKEEWQSKGIKKFIVTLSNEHLCEDADYLNQAYYIRDE
ncbi:hypothetical protein CAPTEDRAFT_191984 [Capitella teleta]|uniref:HTH psq-type domain-containing protein n=1 Tax=Capitella teleta TaxID=283909 RepID=R7VIH0_CAPTE|nr:hypothetical protein CAPTEDRAFT_191984 [Capitella teleta]|eukprot:ELU18337.1 hypothetical protein CAPTEDRAFT_191984 [Capitella teleta]